MGSVGNKNQNNTNVQTQELEFSSFIERYMKNGYTREDVESDNESVIASWAENEGMTDTFTKDGREYEILWENGVSPKIIFEPTKENPYVKFTLEVSVIPKNRRKDSKPRKMIVPAVSNNKKPREFEMDWYK